MEPQKKSATDQVAVQIALLYMANQDNEGKTPEMLAEEYNAARIRVERYMAEHPGRE